jgi:KaiC/GvpD/RAD55 family RecA-like ATPase
MFPSDTFIRKRELMNFLRKVKKMDMTIFVTAEKFRSDDFDGFPEDSSLFDGIIFIEKIRGGESRLTFNRYIHVAKMRGTEHDLDIYPFRIEYKKGIVIYPREKLFETS